MYLHFKQNSKSDPKTHIHSREKLIVTLTFCILTLNSLILLYYKYYVYLLCMCVHMLACTYVVAHTTAWVWGCKRPICMNYFFPFPMCVLALEHHLALQGFSPLAALIRKFQQCTLGWFKHTSLVSHQTLGHLYRQVQFFVHPNCPQSLSITSTFFLVENQYTKVYLLSTNEGPGIKKSSVLERPPRATQNNPCPHSSENP